MKDPNEIPAKPFLSPRTQEKAKLALEEIPKGSLKLQLVKASPQEAPLVSTQETQIIPLYVKAREQFLKEKFKRHSELLFIHDKPRFLREHRDDVNLTNIFEELLAWESRSPPKLKDIIAYFVTINPEKHHPFESLKKCVEKFVQKKGFAHYLYSYEFGKDGCHPHSHIIIVRDKSNPNSEPTRFRNGTKSTFSGLCNTESSHFCNIKSLTHDNIDNRIAYVLTTKPGLDDSRRAENEIENFYSDNLKWFTQGKEEFAEPAESQEETEEESTQESSGTSSNDSISS